MIIDERQSQILQLLETKKFVSYKELSDSLYASISTIRRDVINMHAKGLLVIVKVALQVSIPKPLSQVAAFVN